MSRKLRIALFWILSPVLFPAVVVLGVTQAVCDGLLEIICDFERWCYRK